jgi:hypothetical protein
MWIGDLAEDVDFIRQILWAPDSQIVVFLSEDYLTAVRILDWKIVRIYLGTEWERAAPVRRTTFSSGKAPREVDVVEFPEAGIVSYQVKGEATQRTIRMDGE